MSLLSKIRGTVESYFQFGLDAAQVKGASSTVLEARNADDTTFAIVRVDTPIDPNDAATKAYADTAGGGTTFRISFLLMGG